MRRIKQILAIGLLSALVLLLPPIPALAQGPAEFIISDLTISPTVVGICELVTVTVKVTNVGGEAGTCLFSFQQGGSIWIVRNVEVGAGESKIVEFGTYSGQSSAITPIDVNGLKGTFEVRLVGLGGEELKESGLIPPTTPQTFDWPLVGGTAAGMVLIGAALIYGIRIRRRVT